MSDIVFENATIVTVDDNDRVLVGNLVIRDQKIVAIGADAQGPSGATRIDATGQILMPGLVQAHVHTCQTLARGRGDTLELMPWLRGVIWPYESRLNERTMMASAALSYAEMLLSGTTSVMDMASVRHTDAVFAAAARSGIRATIGKAMMDIDSDDMPRGFAESTKDSLADADRLVESFHNTENGRLHAAYAPRFVLSCTDELLRGVAERSRARGLAMHTHASENRGEIALVEARFGRSNIDALHALGLLDKHAVIAHCVHTSDADIAQLAKTGAHVAHCPGSNLKLASGIARIPEMLAAGVSVGLGCDGAPCNNTLDGFSDLRLAALIHRPQVGADGLSAQTVVRLATRGGANALGRGHEVGSLQVGKLADVIALRPHLAAEPLHNAYGYLAFSATGRDVTHVVVDGKLVVDQGKLLTMSVPDVVAAARDAANALFPA